MEPPRLPSGAFPYRSVREAIMFRTALAAAFLLLLSGCTDLANPPDKPVDRGIIGQKTQEIGEYDPAAGREISSSKVEKFDGPVLGPLQAYGPILEQVTIMAVESHLAQFQVLNERYPKDHAEFMEE